MLKKSVFKRTIFLACLISTFCLNISSLCAQTVITPQPGTTVTIVGSDREITTTNIYNNFAVNTFNTFNAETDVGEVRFIFPGPPSNASQINFLVNRITSPAQANIDTSIRGIIESTGQVGGTMLFASPNGITMGPNANINVGSLILTTANNIKFTGNDSNPYDLITSTNAALTASNGINTVQPLIFINNMSVLNQQINNSGTVIANGISTFAGSPASIIINSRRIDNSGLIDLCDGVNPVLDGKINIVAAKEATFNFSTANQIPTLPVDFPSVVNSGEIVNSGSIIAREGEVQLLASSVYNIGINPSTIQNSPFGVIEVDAFNAHASAGRIELIAFHNASPLGNQSLINNQGLLSAQGTLQDLDPKIPGKGEIILQADVIDNSNLLSDINVSGQDNLSFSGIISVGPSPDGLLDVKAGFLAPPPNTALHINNLFFTRIDKSPSFTPPVVLVNSGIGGNISVSNLILPDSLLVDLKAKNDIIQNGPIQTFNSSLALEAQNKIQLGDTIQADFDTTTNYKKDILLEAPLVEFSLTGNSPIILNSISANYPISITADNVLNANLNTIQNYDDNTLGGMLIFNPFTPGGNVEVTGTGLNINAIPGDEFLFNNIDLGNSNGILSIGDPYGGPSPNPVGIITVSGAPNNTFGSFNNGFLALNSGHDGSIGNAINISNSNFVTNNIAVILQAPAIPLGATVGVDATINNDFNQVSIMTPGKADISDNSGGINVNTILSAPFPTPVNVYELNVSTNASNGNIFIDGNPTLTRAMTNGTGNIFIHDTNGLVRILNAFTDSGNIDISNEGIILVPPGSNINGCNIAIFNNVGAFPSGGIDISGNIISDNGTITLTQNIPGFDINLGSTSSLQVSGNNPGARIELFSTNAINIAGTISAFLDNSVPAGREIYMEAPTITFNTLSTPNISAVSATGTQAIPIWLIADNIVNGDFPFASPIISSTNNVGINGVLVIDKFTPGNISIDTAGVDLNGAGYDLLFNNINLGSSGGTLLIGNIFGPSYSQIINVTGAPNNTFGSFNNGLLAVISGHNGSIGNAINVSNSNFVTNNTAVILQTPAIPLGSPVGIDATVNNDFNQISIMNPGRTNINDILGGIDINAIPFVPFPTDVDVNEINISSSNGDIYFDGHANLLGAFASGFGDIFVSNSFANMRLRNTSTVNGIVEIENSGANVQLLLGQTISGQSVYIDNIPPSSGNIFINGNIFATNIIEINQQSTGITEFGPGSLVQLTTNLPGSYIDIFSGTTVIFGGSINMTADTTNPGMYEIIIESPTIEFNTATTPDITAESSIGTNAPFISVYTDDIIGGTFNFASPIIVGNNPVGTSGALVIDTYSPGNMGVNAAGVDINNDFLNELTFANVNLGTSQGRISFGDYFGLPNVQQIFVDGKPSNTFGSFNNALFGFNSSFNSSVADGIIIKNGNYTGCNVILSAPDAINNFGIDALINNDFDFLSLNTSGAAKISDNTNGLSIGPYNINGTAYNTNVFNLNVSTIPTSNGSINIEGEFNSVNLNADGTGNIHFQDLINGVSIVNATSQQGNVYLESPGLMYIQPGATVQGSNIAIINTQPTSTFGNGIQIEGTVKATNGRIDILTMHENVILGSSSIIEVTGNSTPSTTPAVSGGEVVIGQDIGSGLLNVTMNDGFSITANTENGPGTGILVITNVNSSSQIEVYGNNAGLLSSNSPYTSSQIISGPTGNINANKIMVKIGDSDAFTPPPPPPPPPPPGSIITTQEIINNAKEYVINPEGDIVFVDNSGNVAVFDPTTGTVVKLSDDPTFTSVNQQDLASNSDIGETSDSGAFTDQSLNNTSFDQPGTYGFSENTDTAVSFAFSDSAPDASNDSSTDISNLSTDTTNTPENLNNADQMETTGSSIIHALKTSGDSIKVDDVNVMGTVFNICQTRSSCDKINTSENNALLDQAININSQESELDADKHGTLYTAQTGYHPAGLEGFLLSLEKIEEVYESADSSMAKEVTPVFSYRHPKTTKRIETIKKELEQSNLLQTKKKIINQHTYESVLKDIK